MKVLAVGGGSGGHVTPVLAVIEQLHELDSELRVHFVCDKAFEAQSRGLMEHASIPVSVSTITAGKFRRYTHLSVWQHLTNPHIFLRNITDIAKIFIGFLQSILLLLRVRPDVVFAKGGYVCLPLGLAAWALRFPIVIHDSDTRPGLTNRVLARFARTIATGAPLENYSYSHAKSVYTGVPISDEFRPVRPTEQRDFKQQLGVNSERTLVVATGGGLGAASINQAMVDAAKTLEAHDISVYLVTGKSHYAKVASQIEAYEHFVAVPFVYEHMAAVLGAADIVVSRASATFMLELAGLKKPVIAVPARLSDQIKNAAMYRDANAAEVLTNDEITTTDLLGKTIIGLSKDAARRDQLASALHSFARPNAARDLAALIIAVKKQP